MQTGVIAGHVILLLLAVLLLCFNWLYQRRVAKTQTYVDTSLPSPLKVLLRFSFFISLFTVGLLGVLSFFTLR